MCKSSLIVNLFSQPDVDKSIISHYVVTQLKMMGFNVEHVQNWTRGLDDDDKSFRNLLYMFGKQSYEVSRLFGTCDIIINESPIISAIQFIDENELKKALMEHYISYGLNNLNIYLDYEDDEYKAMFINKLNSTCADMNCEYITFIDIPATIDGCGNIVNLVSGILNRLNEK